jgi:hypothetical protein
MAGPDISQCFIEQFLVVGAGILGLICQVVTSAQQHPVGIRVPQVPAGVVVEGTGI